MDNTMTDRMAAIRARLDSATPGPWEAQYKALTTRIMTTDGACIVGDMGMASYGNDPDNARLIAHAPADLAYLLDGLELMRAQGEAEPRALDRYARMADTVAAPLLTLGRAALAMEQADRAWETAMSDAGLTLAEGRALSDAREGASRAYATALHAALREREEE